MTHGSLFSGIGGFDLAARWAGWDNIFYCEIDSFCQQVLKYHFPDAQLYTDIRKTDFTIWRGRIDVLSGGFPCQPFSQAGKRKGTEDDRHLWPEMFRAIREIRPRWIVGENVLGIVNWSKGMVFEQVCADLETEGYEVQPFILPAAGVNAPHQRYRTWFVAHSNSSTDVRIAGENEVESYKEQLSEWNEIRESGKSNSLRWTSKNTMCAGWDSKLGKEEPQKRGFGNISTGNNERLCVSEKISPDTGGQQLHKRTPYNIPQDREKDRSRKDYWTKRFSNLKYAPYSTSIRYRGRNYKRCSGQERQIFSGKCKGHSMGSEVTRCCREQFSSDSNGSRWGQEIDWQRKSGIINENMQGDYWQNFPTQSPICRGNDGFSGILDFTAIYGEGNYKEPIISFGKWRKESIKAYGNAIVPQVVFQIFQSINEYENLNL